MHAAGEGNEMLTASSLFPSLAACNAWCIGNYDSSSALVLDL